MHLRGNWLIFLGILGKAELILRFWGAKERELRNFGRSVHYFQGSREHRPPGGLNSNQPPSVAPRSGATRELVALRLERVCSVLFTPIHLQIRIDNFFGITEFRYLYEVNTGNQSRSN